MRYLFLRSLYPHRIQPPRHPSITPPNSSHHPFIIRQVGIQGFLRLSITVLGPGDPMPVHNLDDEVKAERIKEQEEPNAEGSISFAREKKLQ